MKRVTGRDVWTADRIEAYGVQMPSVDAVKAVYGVGETTAREALRSGRDLAFRVLRLGARYVTPTADVLKVLGLVEPETVGQEDQPAA